MGLKEYDFEPAAENLVTWYCSHARALPWRNDPTPYHVWVSEIMLQQTRVETVIGYYQRFLWQLPDLPALAGAKEETLLKLWEGLGYYSRVRNMQKAAKIVMQHYGGQLPSDPEELQKLPGIGSYASGAIASQAYGKRVPAVDGNVLRVMMRLSGDESCVDKETTKKRLRDYLQEFYDNDSELKFSPSLLNQALMELGALVCIPNGQPHCAECPVREACTAVRISATANLPVRAEKKPRRLEDRTILLLRTGDKVAVCRRPDKGLLAGLWEFPNLEGQLRENAAVQWAKGQGLDVCSIRRLPDSKHVFSHVEWNMSAYEIWGKGQSPISCCSDARDRKNGGLWFVDLRELDTNIALPSAFFTYRKILKQPAPGQFTDTESAQEKKKREKEKKL